MTDHFQVTLRRATVDDLETLSRWDEQPHVVDSDPNDDWQWETELPRNPSWREQLIAEVNGRPIGYVEIIDAAEDEEHYWGDVPAGHWAVDLWIGEAGELGKGYGTQMMRHALARCFGRPGVNSVLVDPLVRNVRARRFYERLGFQFLEVRLFGEDECAVYVLSRERFSALP